jgi:hypothetical protein
LMIFDFGGRKFVHHCSCIATFFQSEFVEVDEVSMPWEKLSDLMN